MARETHSLGEPSRHNRTELRGAGHVPPWEAFVKGEESSDAAELGVRYALALAGLAVPDNGGEFDVKMGGEPEVWLYPVEELLGGGATQGVVLHLIIKHVTGRICRRRGHTGSAATRYRHRGKRL